MVTLSVANLAPQSSHICCFTGSCLALSYSIAFLNRLDTWTPYLSIDLTFSSCQGATSSIQLAQSLMYIVLSFSSWLVDVYHQCQITETNFLTEFCHLLAVEGILNYIFQISVYIPVLLLVEGQSL